MPEKREVLVRILSAGTEDPAWRKSAAEGVLQTRDSRILLQYDECLADDDCPDTDNVTHVRLLADPDHVMMRRDGAFSVSMVFDAAAPYDGLYHTPYGDLPFVIRTEQYALTRDGDTGCIALRYTLALQGGEPEIRQMRIAWEEKPTC